MKQICCDIKLLSKNAVYPSQGTLGSAGVDLHSIEDYSINPHQSELIRTGIAIAIPDSFVGLIWDRSHLAMRGLHCFAGVIDSDYRGEINVLLYNNTDVNQQIGVKYRVAQLLIQPVYSPIWHLVSTLSETLRGNQGFGSTGN